MTAANFGQSEDQHMHGLWLEGTETVLCHTGTSPNAPKTTQALVGAWNWLVDQSASPTPDSSAVSGSAEGLRDGWQPIETAVMWEVYVVTNGENVALAQYAESDHGDAYWSIDPEDCLEWEPTHCIAPPAALTEGQQS